MEVLRTYVRVKWLRCFGLFKRDCSDNKTSVRNDMLVEKRRLFWEQEAIREVAVKHNLLTPQEQVIWKCHADAVRRGHFTYDDPITNKREYTRLRHFLRGACCGSACRHCIYDHVKVPPGKMKSKRFNSAFWVYNEADADEINDDYMMSLRRPKLRPNRT